MEDKIKYIYDKKGNKKNVVIPFKKWCSIIEDLNDLKIIETRRKEKNISLSTIKNRLKKHA